MIICGFDTETDWNPECTGLLKWCLYTPDLYVGYGEEKYVYKHNRDVEYYT